METVKMKFKDAPIGARFKYPNSDTIWVKFNSYPKSRFGPGGGLICVWNGNVEGHRNGNVECQQNFCSFIDDEYGINCDTVVELI